MHIFSICSWQLQGCKSYLKTSRKQNYEKKNRAMVNNMIQSVTQYRLTIQLYIYNLRWFLRYKQLSRMDLGNY